MRIKLFITALACAFLVLPLGAQNSAKIKEIRQAYAKAVEMTQYDEPLARTEMGITVHRNVPGIGLQNKKIEFFGTDRIDESQDYKTVYDVRFIRISYNVAARKYYEEYLFDENGEAMFFFCKYDGYYGENGSKEEKRYYYDNRDLISYSYKATDAKTGEALSKDNAPDLFAENDGKDDYADHLLDFDSYYFLFSSAMNRD